MEDGGARLLGCQTTVVSVQRRGADCDHPSFEHFAVQRDGDFGSEEWLARANLVGSDLERTPHPRSKGRLPVSVLTVVGRTEIFVHDMKLVGRHTPQVSGAPHSFQQQTWVRIITPLRRRQPTDRIGALSGTQALRHSALDVQVTRVETGSFSKCSRIQ